MSTAIPVRPWLRAQRRLEHWLFEPAPCTPPLRLLRNAARYGYALLRDLLGGQLNLRAMGLVYATLLAIIPLVAFSIALLSLFGAHRELEPLILEFFRPMGERAAELTRRVLQFADNVRAGLVGSVGLALLIWTVFGTIKKVEDSLNFVWRVEQPRNFARRVAEYLVLLVIGPLLVVAVIGMSHYAMSADMVLLDSLPVLGRVRATLLQTGPYLFISALFALLYTLVPNTRVRWWPAIAGGLFAGLLWVAIGKLFTEFVVYSARVAMVYAGLAIVVVALVWAYLGWLILLLGAQLSFYVQNPGYLRVGLAEPRLSGAESEQLYFTLMYLVARSHLKNGPRWSVHTLAARAGLPGVLIAHAADQLERASLLVSTEHEQLLPARDLDSIKLQEILEVARRSGAMSHAEHPELPPAVGKLCRELAAAAQAQLADRTLRDLALD